MTSIEAADRYKEGVRSTWTAGNYGKLATRVYPIAEHLCRECGIDAASQVLDVATGTGNVAVHAARCGAAVTALDLTPRMVELTRERADAEGLAIRTVVGDAEDLPFPPESFSAVLSVCGLWWAPRPDVALAEARRVLRYGGLVGLAGFTPTSYFGGVEELIKARVPLPDDVPERNDWADEDLASTRLEHEFDRIRVVSGTIPWTFPTPAEATAFLFENSASHIAALRGLDRRTAAALVADVEALTASCSQRADTVAIDLEYLIVVGQVPL